MAKLSVKTFEKGVITDGDSVDQQTTSFFVMENLDIDKTTSELVARKGYDDYSKLDALIITDAATPTKIPFSSVLALSDFQDYIPYHFIQHDKGVAKVERNTMVIFRSKDLVDGQNYSWKFIDNAPTGGDGRPFVFIAEELARTCDGIPLAGKVRIPLGNEKHFKIWLGHDYIKSDETSEPRVEYFDGDINDTNFQDLIDFIHNSGSTCKFFKKGTTVSSVTGDLVEITSSFLFLDGRLHTYLVQNVSRISGVIASIPTRSTKTGLQPLVEGIHDFLVSPVFDIFPEQFGAPIWKGSARTKAPSTNTEKNQVPFHEYPERSSFLFNGGLTFSWSKSWLCQTGISNIKVESGDLELADLAQRILDAMTQAGAVAGINGKGGIFVSLRLTLRADYQSKTELEYNGITYQKTENFSKVTGQDKFSIFVESIDGVSPTKHRIPKKLKTGPNTFIDLIDYGDQDSEIIDIENSYQMVDYFQIEQIYQLLQVEIQNIDPTVSFGSMPWTIFQRPPTTPNSVVFVVEPTWRTYLYIQKPLGVQCSIEDDLGNQLDINAFGSADNHENIQIPGGFSTYAATKWYIRTEKTVVSASSLDGEYLSLNLSFSADGLNPRLKYFALFYRFTDKNKLSENDYKLIEKLIVNKTSDSTTLKTWVKDTTTDVFRFSKSFTQDELDKSQGFWSALYSTGGGGYRPYDHTEEQITRKMGLLAYRKDRLFAGQIDKDEGQEILAYTPIAGFNSQPDVWYNPLIMYKGSGQANTYLVEWNDRLLQFQRNNIWHVDVGDKPSFEYQFHSTGFGAGTHIVRSIAKSKDSLFFINYDGIYKFSGSTPKDITQNKISDFWRDSVTREQKDMAFGGFNYKKNEYWLVIPYTTRSISIPSDSVGFSAGFEYNSLVSELSESDREQVVRDRIFTDDYGQALILIWDDNPYFGENWRSYVVHESQLPLLFFNDRDNDWVFAGKDKKLYFWSGDSDAKKSLDAGDHSIPYRLCTQYVGDRANLIIPQFVQILREQNPEGLTDSGYDPAYGNLTVTLVRSGLQVDQNDEGDIIKKWGTDQTLTFRSYDQKRRRTRPKKYDKLLLDIRGQKQKNDEQESVIVRPRIKEIILTYDLEEKR